MRSRYLRALLAMAACACWSGCTSFDEAPPSGNDGGAGGGTESGSTSDASAPDATSTARCSPDAPFGPATALGGLGAYSVESVRFGANRSLVYLSLCPSNGNKPGCDMFQGTVTTTADTYGSFVAMSTVNAPGTYDSYPTVTGDAKHLIFGSGRDGAVKIFVATASAGGVFENPAPLAVPFAASNEPYLLADGRTFYFAATVSTTTIRWRLYRSVGAAPSFGAPDPLPGASLNQGDSDQFAPVVTEDELEIFFASSRAPGAGNNLDMWTARRATNTEDFGPAKRIDDLSGSQNEFPTSISPDGCELYYIRKTGSGAGVGTAYVTRRKKS